MIQYKSVPVQLKIISLFCQWKCC